MFVYEGPQVKVKVTGAKGSQMSVPTMINFDLHFYRYSPDGATDHAPRVVGP